jgi:hypothetical protein
MNNFQAAFEGMYGAPAISPVANVVSPLTKTGSAGNGLLILGTVLVVAVGLYVGYNIGVAAHRKLILAEYTLVPKSKYKE